MNAKDRKKVERIVARVKAACDLACKSDLFEPLSGAEKRRLIRRARAQAMQAMRKAFPNQAVVWDGVKATPEGKLCMSIKTIPGKTKRTKLGPEERQIRQLEKELAALEKTARKVCLFGSTSQYNALLERRWQLVSQLDRARNGGKFGGFINSLGYHQYRPWWDPVYRSSNL